MMLRAHSTFGFAPDLLDKFQIKDPTESKSPSFDRLLNRWHSTDHQIFREAPTQEINQNQTATNDWEEYLCQVGEQFCTVRNSLGMSQRQLHYQTLVPIAHIQALETGCIEELPNAVYVRGFVRKIGKALGLDGDHLAESLPQVDPLPSILSSWESPKKSSQIVLGRLHLSIGYFILLLMSSVWLQRQENATQTQLEPSAISEIQPDLTGEHNISD